MSWEQNGLIRKAGVQQILLGVLTYVVACTTVIGSNYNPDDPAYRVRMNRDEQEAFVRSTVTWQNIRDFDQDPIKQALIVRYGELVARQAANGVDTKPLEKALLYSLKNMPSHDNPDFRRNPKELANRAWKLGEKAASLKPGNLPIVFLGKAILDETITEYEHLNRKLEGSIARDVAKGVLGYDHMRHLREGTIDTRNSAEEMHKNSRGNSKSKEATSRFLNSIKDGGADALGVNGLVSVPDGPGKNVALLAQEALNNANESQFLNSKTDKLGGRVDKAEKKLDDLLTSKEFEEKIKNAVTQALIKAADNKTREESRREMLETLQAFNGIAQRAAAAAHRLGGERGKDLAKVFEGAAWLLKVSAHAMEFSVSPVTSVLNLVFDFMDLLPGGGMSENQIILQNLEHIQKQLDGIRESIANLTHTQKEQYYTLIDFLNYRIDEILYSIEQGGSMTRKTIHDVHGTIIRHHEWAKEYRATNHMRNNQDVATETSANKAAHLNCFPEDVTDSSGRLRKTPISGETFKECFKTFYICSISESFKAITSSSLAANRLPSVNNPMRLSADHWSIITDSYRPGIPNAAQLDTLFQVCMRTGNVQECNNQFDQALQYSTYLSGNKLRSDNVGDGAIYKETIPNLPIFNKCVADVAQLVEQNPEHAEDDATKRKLKHTLEVARLIQKRLNKLGQNSATLFPNVSHLTELVGSVAKSFSEQRSKFQEIAGKVNMSFKRSEHLDCWKVLNNQAPKADKIPPSMSFMSPIQACNPTIFVDPNKKPDILKDRTDKWLNKLSLKEVGPQVWNAIPDVFRIAVDEGKGNLRLCFEMPDDPSKLQDFYGDVQSNPMPKDHVGHWQEFWHGKPRLAVRVQFKLNSSTDSDYRTLFKTDLLAQGRKIFMLTNQERKEVGEVAGVSSDGIRKVGALFGQLGSAVAGTAALEKKHFEVSASGQKLVEGETDPATTRGHSVPMTKPWDQEIVGNWSHLSDQLRQLHPSEDDAEKQYREDLEKRLLTQVKLQCKDAVHKIVEENRSIGPFYNELSALNGAVAHLDHFANAAMSSLLFEPVPGGKFGQYRETELSRKLSRLPTGDSVMASALSGQNDKDRSDSFLLFLDPTTHDIAMKQYIKAIEDVQNELSPERLFSKYVPNQLKHFTESRSAAARLNHARSPKEGISALDRMVSDWNKDPAPLSFKGGEFQKLDKAVAQLAAVQCLFKCEKEKANGSVQRKKTEHADFDNVSEGVKKRFGEVPICSKAEKTKRTVTLNDSGRNFFEWLALEPLNTEQKLAFRLGWLEPFNSHDNGSPFCAIDKKRPDGTTTDYHIFIEYPDYVKVSERVGALEVPLKSGGTIYFHTVSNPELRKAFIEGTFSKPNTPDGKDPFLSFEKGEHPQPSEIRKHRELNQLFETQMNILSPQLISDSDSFLLYKGGTSVDREKALTRMIGEISTFVAEKRQSIIDSIEAMKAESKKASNFYADVMHLEYRQKTEFLNRKTLKSEALPLSLASKRSALAAKDKHVEAQEKLAALLKESAMYKELSLLLKESLKAPPNEPDKDLIEFAQVRAQGAKDVYERMHPGDVP